MKHVLPAALLVLVSGLPGPTGSAPLPAEDRPDNIIIPHDLHFAEDVDCLSCHDGLTEGTDPSDRHYPDMDVCADCHDTDDEESCARCHTNVDEAGYYHRRDYGAALFLHAPHLAQGLDCAYCHGDPALPRPLMPGKPDCRLCHETAEDLADCRLCHSRSFSLRPPNHSSSWLHLHGPGARFEQEVCAGCHTQGGCRECHAGDNVRPRSHDLNYAFNHALDARDNSLQCTTCHADPAYCSSCHVAERILPSDHSQGDWINTTDGGQHAIEGMFAMETCIACHDAGAGEPSCARCHGR